MEATSATQSAIPLTVAGEVTKATGQVPRKVNILDKAVLVNVSFRKLGTSKKVSTDEIEVNADKDLLRVSKRLLQSPEIAAINTFDGGVRAWIYTQTLPSYLKEGFLFIGLGEGGKNVQKFDAQMKEFSVERAKLVDNVCEAYEGLVESDKQNLKDLFNEDDYKSPQAVRDAYSLSWNFLVLAVPTSLPDNIYQEAQAKLGAEITEAVDAVRYALREEMAKLIDWSIDRLSPDAQGNRKRFKTKSKGGQEIGFTSRLNEFFKSFDGRDITNDFELLSLVARAKGLMTDVDGELLKNSEPTRDVVRTGFEQIKAELDTMLENAPHRQIEVD